MAAMGNEQPAADADGTGQERAVARLWLDGRRVDAADVRLDVDPVGGVWRLCGRLAAEDPFLRSYGISVQLADGRTLHGRARLVAARDGWVELEGIERAVGSAAEHR